MAKVPLIATPFAALTMWVLLSSPRGLFSGDSGIKYAEAEALWQSGYSTRALPYDERVDPEHSFTPYRGFRREVGGQEQGIYSVVFAALAAPLVGLLGMNGTVILPLLGGLLCILGLRRLLTRFGCTEVTRTVSVVVLVGLSPLVFYSSQFVAHSLAAALTLAALAILFPSPAGPWAPVRAGLCIGFGATLRPEMYCAAASLGLALLLQPGPPWRERGQRALRYAATAGAVMAGYWVLNLALSGTWDPLVAHNHARHPDWESTRILLLGKVAGAPTPWWLLLWVFPFAAAAGLCGLPAGRPQLARVLRVMVLLALIATTAAAQWTWSGRTAMGLFATTPLLAYGLLGDHGRGDLRPLWLFSITFIVQVMALDIGGNAGGLQLGARYLLPAVPILIAIVAISLEREWRNGRGRALALSMVPAAVLFALTVSAQARGLPSALAIARNSEEVLTHVSSLHPEVVVVRRYLEAHLLLPVLRDGAQVYVAEKDPVRLVTKIADAGYRRFVFLSRNDTRFFLPGRRIARSTATQTGWLEIHLMEIVPRD